MEIIYGIAGIFSLGFLAAFMGLDIRDFFGRSSEFSWMDEDPNSTLGVMREVLGEQAESTRNSQLHAS